MPKKSTELVLRVIKNANPITVEGLAYIFVKMLAGPQGMVNALSLNEVITNSYF
jgi:hypothetical protein